MSIVLWEGAEVKRMKKNLEHGLRRIRHQRCGVAGCYAQRIKNEYGVPVANYCEKHVKGAQ